jgi:nitroreductase
MDFIELAKSRYSCKKFDSRQISKEQLDSILEAGRLAPTAKNLQEQHVYVVQSAEGLAKIDAQTPLWNLGKRLYTQAMPNTKK